MALTREQLLCILLTTDNISHKMRRERGTNVREMNRSRLEEGEYHTLLPRLRAHPPDFRDYFRMEEATFLYILGAIQHRLHKDWCNFHQQKIVPEERLMVTLRYLSTGLSFRALGFSFRMGRSTIGDIVKETVAAILDELSPVHMPIPTAASLKQNVADFHSAWNFPHVVGCLDGKQVRVVCPAKSAAGLRNYKPHFSLVLQALVDAKYKFIVVDVGGRGKESDGGPCSTSDLLGFIERQLRKFPVPAMLPHSQMEAPSVILAGEEYPLLPYLMKPYQHDRTSQQKQIFNTRLSHAREPAECAFRITFAKWCRLAKPIEMSVEAAEKILKCICLLHNIVIDREGVEINHSDARIAQRKVRRERRGRPLAQATNTRQTLAEYFQKYPLDK